SRGAERVEGEPRAIDRAGTFAAVLGRTILHLKDGLEIRRVKIMGDFRIEASGFTDGMVDRFKAMGLVSEIIAWRLRLFVAVGDRWAGSPRRPDGTLCADADRRAASSVRGHEPCPPKPPNLLNVSRAEPRRGAATISPTAPPQAPIGSAGSAP